MIPLHFACTVSNSPNILVYEVDKAGHININSRYISLGTSNTPSHKSDNIKPVVDPTHKRSSTITLKYKANMTTKVIISVLNIIVSSISSMTSYYCVKERSWNCWVMWKESSLVANVQNVTEEVRQRTVQASLPAIPPAHTKDLWFRWNSSPRRVLLSLSSQTKGSTMGKSTSLRMFWKFPVWPKASLPKPVTQHLERTKAAFYRPL